MKKEKNVLKLISLFSGLALFLTAAFPYGDGVQDSIIDGDKLSVGDIAVTGFQTEDGQCQFEDFTISTTPLGDGTTKWLGLSLDEQCNFVVNAKWTGQLEEGPSEVVAPLLGLLESETEPVEETSSPSSTFSDQNASFSALACKTSYQHVYMYGLAGSLDKLTHKWGKLTFCSNGATATISSQSGTCLGSLQMAWSWVVDSCATTNLVSGPASIVRRTGRGDYHCTPPAQFPCNTSNPDGYYHNLRETEQGYANGSSLCTYGYGGIIVTGVGREILQGCN